MRMSFAALIDLFDGIGDEAFAALPPPQRSALEVALYRTGPTGTPPATHAISLGLLNMVRSLAARRAVLIALDDVQWLDRCSEDALVFAAHRLRDESVAFLLARRPGAPSELERALARTAQERLEVSAPSLDAVRHILAQRLGLSLPRHVLRRLYESALGNPLFALELGRKVMEDGLPAIGDELPVPDSVDELLGTRVANLSDPVRRVLLAVALDPALHVGQLASLAGSEHGRRRRRGRCARRRRRPGQGRLTRCWRPPRFATRTAAERRELHRRARRPVRRGRAAHPASRTGRRAARRRARADRRGRRSERFGAGRAAGRRRAGGARAAPDAAR